MSQYSPQYGLNDSDNISHLSSVKYNSTHWSSSFYSMLYIPIHRLFHLFWILILLFFYLLLSCFISFLKKTKKKKRELVSLTMNSYPTTILPTRKSILPITTFLIFRTTFAFSYIVFIVHKVQIVLDFFICHNNLSFIL